MQQAMCNCAFVVYSFLE